VAANDSNSRLIAEVARAIQKYDPDTARAAVEKALNAGIDPSKILEKGLIVGVEDVGSKFACGDIFLPELVLGSKAMQAGLEVLKTRWKNMESEWKALGKVVLGTVKGDMHNIGKQIVASLLAAVGFEVLDIGEDVSEKTFVEKVKEIKPDILGLSALLTTSMPHQQYVITALEEADVRSKIILMVGGAPTTEEWAKEIGADGWAPNAALATDQAKKLLKMKHS